MYLQKVIELVRKEDVVLWIGSGFSLYAGYPNGKELSQIIFQSLTEEEKKEISCNLPLMDLAEQYVRLKFGSRNSLNLLLKKLFSKIPSSLKWHELLANIPHIKTIITTNYDHLFEQVYRDEIFSIIRQPDLAYREEKVELFKVHGDINHPDSIIITRSDYTRFFSNDVANNLVWAAIKEKLSNKSIVFIGYDLEDENIKVILEKVNEALGSNRKEMFLVAPGFKQHKISYLSKYSIQYLDLKGEVFVEKLYKDIKNNITSDFNKGYLNPETLRKFLSKNNLQVDLKSIEDRFQIGSIHSLNGNADERISMKFRNDKEFLSAFNEFVKGRKFGELLIEESVLKELKFFLNDINIIGEDIKNYRVFIKSKPVKEGILTVVFDESSEFENIRYQIFKSRQLFEAVASYKNCDFTFQVTLENCQTESASVTTYFKYNQKENFENVNDAIKVFRLCVNLANAMKFTIYPDGEPKGFELRAVNASFPKEMLKSNLDFFESLKKVELLYQIRFRNIGEYSEEDFDNVYKAIQFANGGAYFQEWDKELGFDLNKGTSLQALIELENGGKFTAESQEKEEIVILGQRISLGYRIIEFFDLYITNLEQVRNKETTIVRVKSNSKKFKVSYAESIHKQH